MVRLAALADEVKKFIRIGGSTNLLHLDCGSGSGGMTMGTGIAFAEPLAKYIGVTLQAVIGLEMDELALLASKEALGKLVEVFGVWKVPTFLLDCNFLNLKKIDVPAAFTGSHLTAYYFHGADKWTLYWFIYLCVNSTCMLSFGICVVHFGDVEFLLEGIPEDGNFQTSKMVGTMAGGGAHWILFIPLTPKRRKLIMKQILKLLKLTKAVNVAPCVEGVTQNFLETSLKNFVGLDGKIDNEELFDKYASDVVNFSTAPRETRESKRPAVAKTKQLLELCAPPPAPKKKKQANQPSTIKELKKALAKSESELAKKSSECKFWKDKFHELQNPSKKSGK
jgi:uncharacterized coiled-coil protein SlyX|tara:strand:- start:280 stop:1290 length:1011 start_codon:yes stop_codon:yes gene_type:complete